MEMSKRALLPSVPPAAAAEIVSSVPTPAPAAAAAANNRTYTVLPLQQQQHQQQQRQQKEGQPQKGHKFQEQQQLQQRQQQPQQQVDAQDGAAVGPVCPQRVPLFPAAEASLDEGCSSLPDAADVGMRAAPLASWYQFPALAALHADTFSGARASPVATHGAAAAVHESQAVTAHSAWPAIQAVTAAGMFSFAGAHRRASCPVAAAESDDAVAAPDTFRSSLSSRSYSPLPSTPQAAGEGAVCLPFCDSAASHAGAPCAASPHLSPCGSFPFQSASSISSSFSDSFASAASSLHPAAAPLPSPDAAPAASPSIAATSAACRAVRPSASCPPAAAAPFLLASSTGCSASLLPPPSSTAAPAPLSTTPTAAASLFPLPACASGSLPFPAAVAASHIFPRPATALASSASFSGDPPAAPRISSLHMTGGAVPFSPLPAAAASCCEWPSAALLNSVWWKNEAVLHCAPLPAAVDEHLKHTPPAAGRTPATAAAAGVASGGGKSRAGDGLGSAAGAKAAAGTGIADAGAGTVSDPAVPAGADSRPPAAGGTADPAAVPGGGQAAARAVTTAARGAAGEAARAKHEWKAGTGNGQQKTKEGEEREEDEEANLPSSPAAARTAAAGSSRVAEAKAAAGGGERRLPEPYSKSPPVSQLPHEAPTSAATSRARRNTQRRVRGGPLRWMRRHNADDATAAAGGTTGMLLRSVVDNTDALPRGYHRYWNKRVDEEEVEVLGDSEEFERMYMEQQAKQLPFRTSTTEWTINTAAGSYWKTLKYSSTTGCMICLMAWGPIMMVISFVVGGLLGFGFAVAHDLWRMRKKQTAANKQKQKLDQLMRWADFHFATSGSQLQLIFKVILEYQVLARLGVFSKTARSQLKLLYTFLCREDVGRCLWLYLDFFEMYYSIMTRNEIAMCALVCSVSTECCRSLRKRKPPPVLLRMMQMLEDPCVLSIFQIGKAAAPALRMRQDQKLKEMDAIMYADAAEEVQRHILRGGELFDPLRTGTMFSRVPESDGEEDDDEGEEEEMEEEEEEGIPRPAVSADMHAIPPATAGPSALLSAATIPPASLSPSRPPSAPPTSRPFQQRPEEEAAIAGIAAAAARGGVDKAPVGRQVSSGLGFTPGVGLAVSAPLAEAAASEAPTAPAAAAEYYPPTLRLPSAVASAGVDISPSRAASFQSSMLAGDEPSPMMGPLVPLENLNMALPQPHADEANAAAAAAAAGSTESSIAAARELLLGGGRSSAAAATDREKEGGAVDALAAGAGGRLPCPPAAASLAAARGSVAVPLLHAGASTVPATSTRDAAITAADGEVAASAAVTGPLFHSAAGSRKASMYSETGGKIEKNRRERKYKRQEWKNRRPRRDNHQQSVAEDEKGPVGRKVRHGLSTKDSKRQEGPPRLFQSYQDLVNFDVALKHQTPIGHYEFQFLDEMEVHDPADPNWELVVDQKMIRVHKFISPDSPVVLVKAYAQLGGIPIQVLCHHIRDMPTRAKWDTTFEDYRVIEANVEHNEIIYCMMKAPFPVSNRDFLQWRRTEVDMEVGLIKILMRSAEHPSMPERPGVIRAETIISGYKMKRVDGDSSSLFILAQTDVKGLIPKWLVNTTAARAPVGWVENLRKVCLNYMKKHHSEVPPATLLSS